MTLLRRLGGRPLGLVGLYLLASAPPLLGGPWTSPHAGLALVHLLGTGVSLGLALRTERSVWVDGWLPLLAMPFLYVEIQFLNQLLTTGYYDPVVVGWERALFGGDPALELAGSYPSVALSELLHLAYLGYYPLIFVPPLVLTVQRRAPELGSAAFALVSTFVACYVLFVYFPVQGPRYFGPPVGVPDGPVRAFVLGVLEHGSSRGAAFPSSHMAVSMCQAVITLRFVPRLGVAASVVALGLGVGAVYGGFHYAIDMVAGAALGLTIALVAGRVRPLPPTAPSLRAAGASAP